MASVVNKAYKPFLALCCVGLMALLRVGFIFFMLAMLPSVIAYFIDNIKGRPAFKAVAAFNLAAAFPSLLPMAKAGIQGHTYNITGTMHDPAVWLLVYGASVTGWCLLYVCSFISRLSLATHYENQLATLENFQKKLVDEWGDQIVPVQAEEEADI